jgi:hypothetical protein
MLVHHQCGHNSIWNIDSVLQDDAGDGVIISPVNMEADRVRQRIPTQLLTRSWMDPQFYLPHDPKGKLATYPFFPGNVLVDFTTSDFESRAFEIATQCLRYQHQLGLRYLIIPTRYFDDLPPDYLARLSAGFVEPFVAAKRELGLQGDLLLTLIVRPSHLELGSRRDEILSWATSYDEISGVYLIFDHDYNTKQIKHPGYLAGALRFVRALRLNDMEVHIGYAGLEGLLLSVADATSATVGSYENLRSFGVQRLETRHADVRRPPRPRIYSGRLLQWIEDTFIPPLRELMPQWEELFDDSPYKEYLLAHADHLRPQRPECYKHYFFVLS